MNLQLDKNGPLGVPEACEYVIVGAAVTVSAAVAMKEGAPPSGEVSASPSLARGLPSGPGLASSMRSSCCRRSKPRPGATVEK